MDADYPAVVGVGFIGYHFGELLGAGVGLLVLALIFALAATSE